MKLKIILLTLFATLGLGLSGQTIPVPMSPARLVNDYAGLLSSAQRAALEDSLVAFDRATSTQIAVVTVNDLEGADPAEYATKLLTQWGVGRKGKDNGVVVLLKPRNQYGGGEVFIATGYGVEGALPDILCGRIIDNAMMPALRSGDYYEALNRGTAAIRAAIRGEYTADAVAHKDFDWPGAAFGLIVMIFVMIGVVKSYRNGPDDDENGDQRGGGQSGRNFRRGPILFPPILGGMGGSRGGFGGGGFGGGGFGGFGGGMGGGGGGGRSF